jgi:8-oxo-dGTP diphosphatase
VLARADHRVELEPANPESVAVRWWPVCEVAGLELHAGFAAAWPHLQARL